MTTNYTDVFGADTVPPSQYGYSEVTLTASQAFNWPTSGTADLIAAIMDVSATVGSLNMLLPPADEVSPGQDILIRNSGSNSFAVQDASGASIATVTAGSVAYFYVAENTSPAGVWGYVAFGVGTSSVDAATLVGYGIKAIGSTLNQSHPVFSTGSGFTVDSTHRAQMVNFTGGAATIALSQASVIGDDFFCIIRNSGTGTLTLNPYLAELIDGTSTFEVQPGESLLIFCSGSAWYTVGYGRSVIYNFTQLVKDVSVGGTFTLTPTEASNKLLTFIGTPAAGVTVIVPNTVAVYYLLNSLSTAQSVTVKTLAGTGVAVPQSQRVVAICDSTNVYSAQSVSSSSNVSLLDGTAASPSLNFASQTNTGLFKYSANGLGLAVNGNDLAHVETTGTTFSGTSPVVSAKIGPTTAQQHTLPAVASDTVALLAATQALTNKTIVAASNTITTAASGTLAATNLNAALAELDSEKAPLASPVFTGNPTAPTPTAGDNDTSIATTAFVTAAIPGKNRIINGAMQVDVRNTGAAQTITAAAALAYTVDRWYAYCTGANVTGQRVAGTAPNKYNYRFTGAASVTKIGFAQRIEAANCQDLAGTTATLSVDLANSLLTTVTWTAWRANSDDTFGTLASPTRTQIGTGTFTVNSTLTRYSAPITVTAASTTGIEVELSVAAQTSGTFTIGRAQLEAGSVATPFDYRPIGYEGALCQRYAPYVETRANSAVGMGQCTSTTVGYIRVPFPTPARVPPTGWTAPAAGSFYVTDAAFTAKTLTVVAPTYFDLNSCTVAINVASGLVAGNATILSITGTYGIVFDGCEL